MMGFRSGTWIIVVQRSVLLGFAAAIFCMNPQTLAGSRQLKPEVVRVQTALVPVPVIVWDSSDGAVIDLKQENFTLKDDGVSQKVAFFASSSEPLKVALVLDTSKSTATVLPKIRKAASEFVSHLRPQDQAMVVTFDSDIHIQCNFVSDARQWKRVLNGIEMGEYVGSRLFDAVALVADQFLRSGQERKAIILLTDGQDYGSKTTSTEMMRVVLETGVVLYPVSYSVNRRELAKKLFGVSLPRRAPNNPEWEQTEKAAADLMRRSAEESAGMLFRSESADLNKSFIRIIEELRHQYLLAFYPDPARIDGGEHKIEVTVSRPSATVRFRHSYLAQKSQ
jgi:Ca-activated chloride channel family protein